MKKRVDRSMGRKLRKCAALVMVLLISLGLLAGCGSSGTAAAAAAAPESAAADPTDLIFAYNGSSGNLLAFVAQDKGYFDDENVKVSFEEFSSTGDGISAMNAGKVDVSFSFGSNSPLQYISSGSQLIFIGGFLTGGHPIVTQPEHAGEYDTSSVQALAESFKGKNVGILRLYTSQIVWESAMIDAGIDVEKDLTTTEFKKPADLVAAVRAGQVDIGVITYGSYSMAKEAGLAIVAYSQDLWPNHVCCRGIVTREYYEAHRDALVGVLKALLRAQKDVEDDPEYAIAYNAQMLKIDEDTSRALLTETGLIMDTDPNRKGILDMYNTMLVQKLIEEPFDVEACIDVSLYEQALQELAAVYPEEPFYQKQLAKFTEQNVD